MKLDFETTVSNAHPNGEELYNAADPENGLPETSSMLQAGIKAAREGNRYEAKLLLSSVTETEPGNEDAWMWLASVSEYPEELLGFLCRVLEINPNNERAAEWAKSTKSLLSKNLVERGISASKDAQKEFAKQCFLKAIAQDGENESAWLWLASAAESAEEKTAYLQKVLNLNPENENAVFLLKSMKNQKVDQLLQKAVAAAVAGERKSARQMLETVLNDAPELVEAWVLKSFLVESFEEKVDCFEKILDIDDENELANTNWTALLDIMSRAETSTRIGNAEQFSVTAEDEIVESEKFLASIEANGNYESRTAFSEENLEAVEPKFELREVEKPAFDNEEFYSEVESSEAKEEIFADAQPDANSEQVEIFEFAAQSYTDYSQPPTEFSEEYSEDFSQYTTGELEMPQDKLPSYYESEETTVPLPSLEEDYSREFTENEPQTFPDTDLETEENSVSEEEENAEASFAETQTAETADFADFEYEFRDSPDERLDCPFCSAAGEAQSLICDSCHTMLTLSDLEMLLAHQDTDRELARQAVERMEDERNRCDFGVEELKLLAVGHFNLKNLRQGCDYLEEAAQMNPNDVVLGSQVNFLKIRLAEIEEQQSVHDSMPKNRKILVVDDSATVRKLISGKLEKSGHEVFCAIDGIDALEKIKEFVPDLILLDINMPRMDGYQVCKLIRSDEATKDVPIVMISGKDGFFDKVRGRMAGTTGYITKPFGPETLMKMLETYIV